MLRFDPAEFGGLLARLTPRELRQAEGLVTDAPKRAEAVLESTRASEVLGPSRDTIWRWRLAIIGALPPEPDGTLAGIVEVDDAHQRESRKGSHE